MHTQTAVGSPTTAAAAASVAHSSVSFAPLPPLPSHPPRRVVVTGLGCVTPLGCGWRSLWSALCAGRSGVRAITDPKITSLQLATKSVADIPTAPDDERLKPVGNSGATGDVTDAHWDAKRWVPRSIMSQTSPFIHYALAAASMALEDGKYSLSSESDPELAASRAGVCMGSGIGCLEEGVEAGMALSTKGKRGVSAYSIPKLLINLAAGQISIQHGFRGPNHGVATACTTGAHSIGDAFSFIRHGHADVMIAGSTEASVTPLSLALFARIRALSTRDYASPSEASRPFDVDRDGFVMGEGAGAMLLEEREHAIQRGAHIYAEVRGYGLSADASHITAPHESGRGSLQCMEASLRHAGLSPSHIDYINAHATSTPLGDRVESRAIQQLFGASSSTDSVAVSSTKGALGHMLGAAGSVEAIICCLAIETGLIPPNLNLNLQTLESDMRNLNYVAGKEARERRVRATMSNSFGFGGTNASLVFTQHEA